MYFSDGSYRIIERSNGVWQTKCFPKMNNPTKANLLNICRELGFANVTSVSHQLLDPEVHFRSAENQNKYRNNGIKVLSKNLFSMLHMNQNFNISSVTSNREAVKLREWNHLDDKECHQLEIKCHSNPSKK